MQGWARAIPVLNAVAAILAIPITSSLVAQAAVVFAERRYPGQQLSVRHLFSLADRTWCDWGSLTNTFSLDWKEPGSTQVRRFLFAAAALIFLGAVQYPLLRLLAPWEVITVPTCADTGYITLSGYGMKQCDFDDSNSHGYTQIGIDLEPAQMAIMPASFVLPRVRDDLATAAYQKAQPLLWQTANKSDRSYLATIENIDDGFVASLSAGATTGVLREHIMRLNSTISCITLPASEYPATCSGTNPFQTSFDYTKYLSTTNATIDVCVPGDSGKHPWTVSRNRQELTEELFIRNSDTRGRDHDRVLHCTAQTTRGYFELGNIHTRGVHGRLLKEWPYATVSRAPYDYQYNDYSEGELSYEDFGTGAGYTRPKGYIPSREDHMLGSARLTPDPHTSHYAPTTYTNMTGPLMTSVLALFGTDSWAYSVRNLTFGKDVDTLRKQDKDRQALLEPICRLTPFRRTDTTADSDLNQYHCTRDLYGVSSALSYQLAGWKGNYTVEYRLRIAMFLSNQAALTSHTEDLLGWLTNTGREIYTAPGMPVSKPYISLPAQVILSVIVGVQVVGLLRLGWFIYTWPTWTRTLNAMAIARVAAQLDPGLFPPFENVGLKEHEYLAHVGGLVGVQACVEVDELSHGDVSEENIELMENNMDGETVGKGAANSIISVPPASGQVTKLALGAPGLITKRGKRSAPVSSQATEDV